MLPNATRVIIPVLPQQGGKHPSNVTMQMLSDISSAVSCVTLEAVMLGTNSH